MQTKLFEVRDSATFIPVIATLVQPGNGESEAERYLLRRSGYGYDAPLVLLTKLQGGEACYDIYDWSSQGRTMHTAHKYIQANFAKLESGAVIDVEFILGESSKSKQSERVEDALIP